MREYRRIVFLLAASCFVLILFEARFDAFDPLTRHEPSIMRKVVAAIALRELGPSDNDVDRILELDPNSVRGWERRCSALIGPTPTQWMSDCHHALSLRSSAANYRGLGLAEESAGEPCAAESSYRQAIGMPDLPEGQHPILLRDEARAALNCGHTDAAIAVLQQAELIDLADHPEQNTAAHDALAADRGYMSVVYEQMHDPAAATRACSQANPTYSDCTCKLTGTALVCTQTPAQMLATR